MLEPLAQERAHAGNSCHSTVRIAGVERRPWLRSASFAPVILLVALVYLAPSLWRGGVLLPLDLLHSLGPFGATRPAELARVANPHLSDLVTMAYPWIDLFRSDEAILPLWNPYSFCGSPLVANAQTGALFPVSWIYKIAPLGAASLAVALGKMMIAGFGAG